MWIAEPRGRAGGARGYSFVEVVIVLGLLSVLSVLCAQSMAAVNDSTATLASYRRAQRGGERVADEVRRLVVAARKLYVRGTVGNGYLESIRFGALGPAPGSRLPLPEEYEQLGPDPAGLPQTGNLLLFAGEGLPLTCMADPETLKTLFVDVYRLVCIFPCESTRKIVVSRAEAGRDLGVWESARYPSYGQVMNVTDTTQRRRVVQALYTVHGCRYLWNVDVPASQAFYRIDAAGTISGTPEADHPLPEDPAVSPGGRLIPLGLQLARTDLSMVSRRAILATEPLEVWAPDGFEVKVVGSSTQRKVWMHLTVEAQSASGRDTSHSAIVVAHVRDL